MKKSKFFLTFSIIVVVATSAIVALASTFSDTFSDETKIGNGTKNVFVDTTNNDVTLAPYYAATPSWTFIATSTVRNISGAYNATTTKDIYCDSSNCVLWTHNLAIPNTVSIATDPNVYANVLWSYTDLSSSKTWGPTTSYLTGGDIGGFHTPISVGNGGSSVTNAPWLERYYSSPVGTYPAMDGCKAKGPGWRLPNVLELDSIRDMTAGGIYSKLPNITGTWYWSSTSGGPGGGINLAYMIGFQGGNSGDYSKSGSYPVRCVRNY